MLSLSIFIFFTFVYGSAVHATRPDFVTTYHRFWPITSAYGDFMIENNPHHHPNHCWNYFYHPDTEPYFPNLLNMTYPDRHARTGYDMSPFSTSTSLVYVYFAVCLVVFSEVLETQSTRMVLVEDGVYVPSKMDIGGIILSLAWVAASSAEFHRNPGDITRHSDWATIAPLLAWIGADGVGLEQWAGRIVGLAFQLASVFATIYIGFTSPQIAVLIGFILIMVGCVGILARKLLPRHDTKKNNKWGDLSRYDALNTVAVLLSGYTAVACKSYGNTPYSMGVFSGFVPNHDYHHIAECTNNVTAARLEDISHGWWHVETTMALWFLVLPLFGIKPLENNTYLYVVYYALTSVVIITVWTASTLDETSYAGWQAATYGMLLTWIVCILVILMPHHTLSSSPRAHVMYNPIYK